METHETTNNTSEKSNEASPISSTKDKIINAIPLVLVLLAVAYFAYSCHQNKTVTNETAQFVKLYNDTNAQFDKELEQCLHKKTSNDDFRKALREKHIPALTALKSQADSLSDECIAYVICFPETKKVIERKLELANMILEDENKDKNTPTNINEFFKLLDEINDLQKKIFEESQKIQESNQ